MRDRLQKLLSKEGVAPTRFAEIIGVQRSSISHILSGRNKPSFDMIQSILDKYPKVNPDWLLLGKGDMYRKVVQATLFSDQITTEQVVTTNKTNKEHLQSDSQQPKRSENRIFEKRIERVIVFYSDKTFTEYQSD